MVKPTDREIRQEYEYSALLGGAMGASGAFVIGRFYWQKPVFWAAGTSGAFVLTTILLNYVRGR